MSGCSRCVEGYVEQEFVLPTGEMSWRLGICRCSRGMLALARWRLHAEADRRRREQAR